MADITYLPVRHHSPACSYHVMKQIEEINPDIILIEGPENANDKIPDMVHPDTKAPFALYYSYNDVKGKISPEKQQYKCYYPFLDYSPELVALRMGEKLGIPAFFIDLSYRDILIASEEGRGLFKEAEQTTYNDDYYLSRNVYIQKLIENSGLRSFEEFWEKYYEINGLHEESEKWFQDMLVYCSIARQNSAKEMLQAEGCLAREAYMAENIVEYAKTYQKIVVVTGGFHTEALQQLVEAALSGKKTLKKHAKKADPNQGVYLMAYSMEAADALNGYASGMPYPGFYQNVWQNLMLSECMEPYREATAQFLLLSGRKARQRGGLLSTFDEICAQAMLDPLASLRGKKEPGVYELTDAALSSYIKGEYNLASAQPMQILKRMMTGRQKGALCQQADVPPLIQDFEAQCKKYRIASNSTVEAEVTLSIFAREKHRQESMFFHRMCFLKTNFVRRMKGPDLKSGKDRNLIREIWRYHWSVEVPAALIDASVYGGTVEEACGGILKKMLRGAKKAREGAMLLTSAFEMGLVKAIPGFLEQVIRLIVQESEYVSLTEAMNQFMKLSELEQLYQTKLDITNLLMTTARRVLFHLPDMALVKEEDVEPVMESVKVLYQFTSGVRIPYGAELREEYYDTLEEMLQKDGLQAGLQGCLWGILYISGQMQIEELKKSTMGYLRGTKGQLAKTAQYFRGLFFSAKDVIFIGEEFLMVLKQFMEEVKDVEFMEFLPELRLAFAYFTPGEIDRIAARVAGWYQRKPEEIHSVKGVDPSLVAYGVKLDEYIAKQ